MLKLLGIRFKFNLLFLLILFLFALSGLFTTACLSFIVVLLHELAHSYIAQQEGVEVNEIELLPFGGVAKFSDLIQLKPASEIKIALAGPIFNLILVAIIMLILKYRLISLTLGSFLIKINLSIALFNLLPALPLDGGRVLRSCLTYKYGFKEATYLTLKVSRLMALFLAIVAGVGIYLGKANILLLLIAFFIYFNTLKKRYYASYVLMQYIAKKKGKILRERVANIQQLIAVEDTTLKEIIAKLVPGRFHTILVVNNNLEILGLVTENQLINSLINDGIEVAIGEIMTVDS